MADHVVTQPPGLGSQLEELFARAHASQMRAAQLHSLAAETVGASRTLRSRRLAVPRSPADFSETLLRSSRYARLLARLATMPAIEQAKGILMAQTGCSPDQAFDMLRRASQRSNTPVRELAEQIVEKASASVGRGS
jgi:AmiR/NasT family two-component response regulator